MKLVVSSYNKNNEESLTLFDVNIVNKVYKRLDGLCLDEPSFVINYNNIVFTYNKNPLYIQAYEVNDNFQLIDEISVPLNTLTHLVYNEKNHRLFGASYADGAYLSVDFYNHFQDLKIKKQNGKCHCVCLNKNKTKILIVNITLDKLFVFNNNLKCLKTITTPLQTGPRHAIYNKNKIYVMTEYSNEILVYNMFGKLKQRISTINTTHKSSGATLLFSKDNKRLYASNRGEDTITVFRNEKELIYDGSFSCNGNHPRHMILTQDGNYIISCNKNSGELSFIDIKTQKEVLIIPYPNVSCVCEL